MASVLQVSSCALSFLELEGAKAWYDSRAAAGYNSDRGGWQPGIRQDYQCYKEESSDSFCNIYLSECTNERLSAESSDDETFLYLIYGHLGDVFATCRVEGHLLLLMPTFHSGQQLKNFLGVLQAHEKVQTTVLRSPLAYSYSLHSGERMILEVELCQSTITRVSIQDGVARCKDVQHYREFSLQSIYRQWFETISHEFLKLRYNARHDPLYKQQLFEQVNRGWRIGKEEMYFELDGHKMTVDTDRLRLQLPEGMQAYISGQDCHLIASPFGVPEGALAGVESMQRLTAEQLKALFEHVPLVTSEAPNVTVASSRVRHYHQIRHLRVSDKVWL